jgi:hypothetical protein
MRRHRPSGRHAAMNEACFLAFDDWQFAWLAAAAPFVAEIPGSFRWLRGLTVERTSIFTFGAITEPSA